MSSNHKAKAHAVIAAYREHPVCFWRHVDPERLIEQLEDRVDHPNHIAQQASSWCGPAAFLRSFARDDPAAYARLIIDLVRHRKATFHAGPHSAVVLHPHTDITGHDYTQTGIADADWVGLAALRDKIRHPKSPLLELINKGTYPDDIVKYYTDFGYDDVSDWTSERSLGAESARGANHYLKDRYKVTLRIHDNMLYEDKKKVNGGRHDHWVDLIGHFHWHGDSSRKDTPVSLTVFSWGREVHVHGITAEECFNNYYGFVCAKY